jgi:hypothetical protein
MKVHEIIAALAGEDPEANVVVHDTGRSWVHLDGFEAAQDHTNGSVVPTFYVDVPRPFDSRFDDSIQGSRSQSGGEATICFDHSTEIDGCATCQVEVAEREAVESLRAVNRVYNTHYANVAGDHGAECECAARCAFCAATHYPTDHEIDDTDSQVVSSRWHIDDVKMAIADADDYKDAPTPSDQALYDYLHRQVQNDYFVGEINQSISDELGDLFPEIYAVKMAAWKAEREAAE